MAMLKLLLALKEDPELAARWQTDPEEVLAAHAIDPETRAAWRSRSLDQLDQLALAEFHALLEAVQIPMAAAILWPSVYEGDAVFNSVSPTAVNVGTSAFTVVFDLRNVQSSVYSQQPVDFTFTKSGTTLGPSSAGAATIRLDANGRPDRATFTFTCTFPSAGTYALALTINDPGQEDDGFTRACGTIVVS